MSEERAGSGSPVQVPLPKEYAMKRSSPLRLIAGVFFLIWAAIFLTWTPVDNVRLVSGIIFVPVGLTLILRYFTARPSTERGQQ